jgi:hypothetical protein
MVEVATAAYNLCVREIFGVEDPCGGVGYILSGNVSDLLILEEESVLVDRRGTEARSGSPRQEVARWRWKHSGVRLVRGAR